MSSKEINFANNLRKIMNERDLTGEKLAKLLGVSTSTATHWSNGTRFPRKEEHIKKLIDVLNISSEDLFSGNEKPLKTVPIVASTSCGDIATNVLQDENMKTHILAQDWNSSLYAVIACGDSMATEIYDGDICIIDPNSQVQNGDMVHYKIDDESAIKVFYDDVDNYLLQFIPYNSNDNFKTKTIRKDDDVLMDRLTYYKVIQVISSKKNNRSARLKIIGR